VAFYFVLQLTKAVKAGPMVFKMLPPKAEEKNQMAHKLALTTWTVDAELGRPPPAPSKFNAT